MKNYFKPLFVACGVMTAATFVSCGDETGLVDGGEDSTVYQLNVTAADLNPVVKVNNAKDLETVKVHFEGADTKMRRLYITQSLNGSAPVLYNIGDSNIGVALNKDDQSVNLGDGAKKEFTYDIKFDAPTGNNQTYVYQLWAVNGGFSNLNSKGDIDNPYFKNSYNEGAVGTIFVSNGTGVGDVDVKSFSSKISLYAPDSDGKTKSFVSILTGETSKITQQAKNSYTDNFTPKEKEKNAEKVAYWDFGYYYTKGSGASFASASNYTSKFKFINITKVSGLATSKLNDFYFKKSNLTFANVKKNSNLDGVSKGSQFITKLKVGDVIEFVDGKSGAKGVINVDYIKTGAGNKDYIKFSVKVQNLNFIKL